MPKKIGHSAFQVVIKNRNLGVGWMNAPQAFQTLRTGKYFTLHVIADSGCFMGVSISTQMVFLNFAEYVLAFVFVCVVVVVVGS